MTDTTQNVYGMVAQSTFPSPVTTVRVVSGGKVIRERSIADDGWFSLAIPKGTSYTIEFGGRQTAGLVFPRVDGSIGSSFDIASADTPFNLGAVRFIGNPLLRKYSVKSAPLSSDGNENQNGAQEQQGDNHDCHDGVDSSGAVCVEDHENKTGEACNDGGHSGHRRNEGGKAGDGEKDRGEVEGGEDGGQGIDSDNVDCENGVDKATGAACTEDQKDGDQEKDGDTDNVECQNGVDAKTGQQCADGNTSGTGENGGTADTATGTLPTEAAVADRNLPSTVGNTCNSDQSKNGENKTSEKTKSQDNETEKTVGTDKDNVNCENGVDPATGAACPDEQD